MIWFAVILETTVKDKTKDYKILNQNKIWRGWIAKKWKEEKGCSEPIKLDIPADLLEQIVSLIYFFLSKQYWYVFLKKNKTKNELPVVLVKKIMFEMKLNLDRFKSPDWSTMSDQVF